MSKFYEHITESVWADIHRRSTGEQTRKEDDVNLLDINDFCEYLLTIYGSFSSEKKCINVYRLKESKEEWITVHFIELDNFHRGILFYDANRKEVSMPNVFAIGIKNKLESQYKTSIENDGETMILFPKDENESVNNSFFIEVIDYVLSIIPERYKKDVLIYKKKVNESVWADIHRRADGEQVRKEDELSQEAYDNLDGYLYYYAYKIVSEHAKDNLDGLCDYLMDAHKNDPDIDAIVQYVKDNWENEVAEWLSGWVEQANYDYKKDMYESVWADIHKRSNGDLDRTEDVDFDFLKGLISMMKNAVRIASDPKNRPYIDHIYSDDCDGFVEYILKRRDEHRFIDGSGKEIPKNEYDKLIRFVKNNWGDCKGINEFSDKIFGKLNECDGVPGGATPANVGGMGAAYFPGPNGEPGSGDLPSPTGVVYHQVAPFGVFIKELKKKKKKKKFRKEDEPCVHSPNAKVYDYVDDFREYVDRTYTMMNKK